MNVNDLTTYLNDHLAGSVAALELIEHLGKKFPHAELETFFAELHRDVAADQDVLRDLLRKFDKKESAMRKAGAWIAEKISHAKLSTDKFEADTLGFLQALETLELGITGKQLLWRALSAASQTVTQLRGPNYAELEQRAINQRERVEQQRVAAATRVFAA